VVAELGVGRVYDYGARWYDASIAKFTSIDRFAEKYAFQSPFVYAANNPIKFIDINGDSIGVNLYNKMSQKAFAAFIGTKEGRAFIGQFAAKGQKVNGVTFKKNGKYHKSGIDLVLSDRNFGELKSATGAVTTGGTNGGGKIVDGRLKLGVEINTSSSRSSLIDKVTTITHESFLHVSEFSKDFLDNGKIDYSNDDFYSKTTNMAPASRHHTMFHYKKGASSTHPFARQGLRVLESVNSKYHLGYSRKKLWGKLWNFGD